MIIPDTNIIIDFWHTGDLTKANIFRSQKTVYTRCVFFCLIS